MNVASLRLGRILDGLEYGGYVVEEIIGAGEYL